VVKAPLLGILLLGFSGSAYAAEPRTWSEYVESLKPLEPLSHESSHTLRVLYLEDPRLPKLSEKSREQLYRKIEILVKEWYGFELGVVEVGTGDLLERFERDAALFETSMGRDFLSKNSVDLGGFGAKDALLATIRDDLEGRSEKQIRRYVKLPPRATKRDAVNAVYAIFDDRLSRLRSIEVGKEDARERLYTRRTANTQSFPHWVIFLAAFKDADFVLTNGVIAGPDTAMPIYVSVRGGITNGFVNNSKHSPFSGTGVVAAFPFLSDAPFWKKERGRIPSRRKIDTLATFWMHELGHLLLRMKEHYGEGGCVHVAPEGLRVYEWHRSVRKAGNRCRYLPEERLTRF
jgi:hypothetical protein